MTAAIRIAAFVLLGAPAALAQPRPLEVPLVLGAGAGPACVEYARVSGLDFRNDPVLAVRSGPGARYGQIDGLRNGDEAFICARDGAWLGIVYPGRGDCGLDQERREPGPYAGPCNVGWVHSDWIAEQSSPLDAAVVVGTQTGRPACPTLGEVVGLDPDGDGFLAVRSGPGTQYAQIDHLYEATEVYVCGYDTAWRAIVYPADGRDCGVSGLIDGPRGYDGPCFRGWANARWITETPAPIPLPEPSEPEIAADEPAAASPAPPPAPGNQPPPPGPGGAGPARAQ